MNSNSSIATVEAERLLRSPDETAGSDSACSVFMAIECGRDELTLLTSCYMSHDAEAQPQEHQRLVRLAGERK